MAQSMTYKDFEARMAAARAAHLRNIDITGKKIQGIYTQAARDLAKRAEATRAGTLTERWVKDYRKALEKRIEQMRGELGGTILSGMRKSERLPGDTVEGWLNDALAMVGVDGSFTGTFSRTPDAALRMLIDGRMYRDGKSLSRRIWNRTDQLQGSIEDILTQGIAQHRSALQIAQDLEAYVSPKAKMPVSWLTLYPDIPFDRQIDYNAQRLARTAINHAYWAANMAAAKANPFCRAMHWQLSPSHYERQVARFGEDICDAYASHDEGLGRGNFPIDDVPMPHAQCLCATWQVVPELSDVSDRLGAWVDGGEDAELDAAFGEWKAQRPETVKALDTKIREAPERGKLRMGSVDRATLERRFGKIKTDETILTVNRVEHIQARHPDVYPYFEEYGSEIVRTPDVIVADPKNEKTVLMLGKKGDVWLNLAVRLATEDDEERITKNSIITCMRLRERNAQKVIEKAANEGRLLYKKE